MKRHAVNKKTSCGYNTSIGGVILLKIRKLFIIISSVVLILGAFGFGYFSTLKRIINEVPDKKPGTRIDNKKIIPPLDDEKVNMIPNEKTVTPSTILVKKIISINTGKTIIEYDDIVPDTIVNFNEDEAIDYFKNYGKVIEFSKDKIEVKRELPFLPDCFVVKLETKNIVVYKTDADGIATKYKGFEPIPYKNKDKKLEVGIEVESENEIWSKIQDYD